MCMIKPYAIPHPQAPGHDSDEPVRPEDTFVDIDFAQRSKQGQYVSGDVLLTRRWQAEGRIISVLADGLGSGVKASVLANLTAVMALKYTAAFVDIRQSARTIMDTLPICEVRKISYSTFTVLDLDESGGASIVEHGNPPFVLLRGSEERVMPKLSFTVEQWRDRLISYCDFQVRLGDRLVWFSDGVTQSGLGQPGFPLGWGRERVVERVIERIRAVPEISSKRLAEQIVFEASRNDGSQPKDDITCGVAYFRRPRRLLVITGPPFAKDRDAELAERVRAFQGRIALCGGTTATILSRELDRPVEMNLKTPDPEIPPTSTMEGIDLITEGTLTLARTADCLERGTPPEQLRPNGVRDLLALMLESDVVEFVVGTRINEAHQDPNVPVELDLRRNIIRRIAATLEGRHLKETSIRFL